MRSRCQAIHIKETSKIDEIFLAKTNDNIHKLNFIKKPVYKGDQKIYPTDKLKNVARPEIKNSVIVSSDGPRNSTLASIVSTFGFSSKDKNKRTCQSVIINKTKEYTPPIGNNVYFSDAAILSEGITNDRHQRIPEKDRYMPINDFLSQFFSQDDINNLELYHMLDIDYEKLEALKEKSLEFIDASSQAMIKMENVNSQELEQTEEVLIFFNKKLQELRENDINIQIFIQNIDKVVGIKYEKDGTRILFNK
jgi:hypothetical protein